MKRARNSKQIKLIGQATEQLCGVSLIIKFPAYNFLAFLNIFYQFLRDFLELFVIHLNGILVSILKIVK